MIAFATLFLGLVAGVRPVDLLVANGVAAVEVLLDDESLGTVQRPPWSFRLDLGEDLLPHALEVIAYDTASQELGRARQWINLPADPAAVQILIEGGAAGHDVAARLAWSSVVGSEPLAVTVTLDGRPLAVADPRRFELPPHDPRQLHFLRAELDFEGNLSSSAEITFGGTYAEEILTAMTAVPVEELEKGALGEAADLRGSLASAGEPAPILAVERGPAEIAVVLAAEAGDAIDRFSLPSSGAISSRWGTIASPATFRWLAPLREEQRLRFFSTQVRAFRRGEESFETFPASRDLTHADGGLLWLLQRHRPAAGDARRQSLADALAVAGMTTAGRNRRRAVVLITTAASADASTHSPQTVRGYLEALGVPLLVWAADGGGKALPGWGEAADVSSPDRLERRVRELHRLLERQRIVWIEGTHLPQSIAVADGAGAGIRLAR